MKTIKLFAILLVSILPNIIMAHPGHGSHEHASAFHPSINMFLILFSIVVVGGIIFISKIRELVNSIIYKISKK
jgi:hypothetical protein